MPVCNRPSQVKRLAFWGLSDAEWVRYEQLKPVAKMLGQAETTPHEVLGIFARDAAERKRYAASYVQMSDVYVAGLLAFQAEAALLQADFYKDVPMLDPDKVNESMGVSLSQSDRIQFFTRLECPSCDVMLLKLLRQVKLYGVKLDVFFEQATMDQVQRYASDKRIDVGLADTGQVTLNTDGGYISRYKIKTPAAYISQGGGALKHHDPDI